MEINKILYDFVQTQRGDEAGEDYMVAEVGKPFYVNNKASIVTKITEHRSVGPGDKWYYDIELKNGDKVRTFNPNTIFYTKDENSVTYAKYSKKGDSILKDGHTMFPLDIVTELNRKSYLEESLVVGRNKTLHEEFEEFTDKLLKSEKATREFLVRAGIHDENGNLTDRYTDHESK